MRIFNGTSRQMDLPLNAKQRISIAPKAISGDILATSELLSLIVTSYTTDEVAIVISGPFELKVAANMPATVNYVVQSIEEAIMRFNPAVKEDLPPQPEPEPIVVSEPENKPGEEPAFPDNLPEAPQEEEKPKKIKLKKVKVKKEEAAADDKVED